MINITANPNALRIFQRDIMRVCEYFARQGAYDNPRWLADDPVDGPQSPPNYQVHKKLQPMPFVSGIIRFTD